MCEGVNNHANRTCKDISSVEHHCCARRHRTIDSELRIKMHYRLRLPGRWVLPDMKLLLIVKAKM